MQHSNVSIALALVLLGAGCDRQAAVTASVSPAATRPPAEGSTAPAEPVAQCKSWGIQPGSPGYKQCVEAIFEAADAEAANRRTDMAQQREDLRQQMDEQLRAAAGGPQCVTVTNGTNTSTSCP